MQYASGRDVTGASTGEAEDPRWSTYSARKTSRSSSPRSWPSSSLEHAARETRPSNGKLLETSSWNVDRSSPGTRSDLSFLETVVERSEEDEDGRRMQAPGGNDTENARITSHNPSISSRSNETSQTDPSNRISIESSSSQSSTIGYHLVRTSSTSRSSYDKMPTSVTQLSFGTFSHGNLKNTTSMTTFTKNITIPRRQIRHIPDLCEKFVVGDPSKQEFYSPNYPEQYPKELTCERVLEAEKGMLLKLDFRDEFKLEDSPNCAFDVLEIRDGKYGYSNLLGNFCGPNFPPEITSKTRYLWLRFRSDENIEGKGFRAVWSTIPRPTHPGVLPEPEPCTFMEINKTEVVIHDTDLKEKRNQAQKDGFSLDCMWNITVNEKSHILLVIDDFKLKFPNECEANFLDIFRNKPDMSSMEKKFCGSIADTIVITSNIVFLRFYAQPKALNSSFKAVITATREKNGKSCEENEYDCEDSTCIAKELECNNNKNCRFNWDEEGKCNPMSSGLFDSHHIVIILVVFSLIMFGMSFAFVFNCVQKLIRDHRIIQEHIRQSRENRLDELGRKSTPCPISVSTTDLHDHGSESPSLEVMPSKELMPTTMIPQEYTKELVLEMTYNASDITDIHQSNNVSNATQERLQESSEEPEMRDNCCQTRESLFEPRIPDAVMPLGFTTFGVRAPSSQNGTNLHHHHHHYHHRQQLQQSPQQSHQSAQSSQPSSQSSQQSSQQHSVSQCSGCSPASRGRDGSMGICPKHNPIPAPPGWSSHEPNYPVPVPQTAQYPEQLDYPSYQKFHSPKPSREPSIGAYRQSIDKTKFIRQDTLGSGERYGSSMYGSGHGSSNNTSSTSQHSSGNTPTKRQPQPTLDPRYRAEAVIEVDQRRPFSIESTKSAPDVIATH